MGAGLGNCQGKEAEAESLEVARLGFEQLERSLDGRRLEEERGW